jgi:RNA polymerase sigma-70 factor, ECF subfamily
VVKRLPTNFFQSAVYSMTSPVEDTECVARCLSGDAGGFEVLVARYQRVLFTVALRLTGNYEDARDATQNAFVRAFERLDTYDPSRRFFSWLYRIAMNESLNLRRAQRSYEPVDPRLEAGGSPADGVEAAEVSQRIQTALLKIPDEQREVVVLRHFGELSYQEIAEALRIPEKTVKSRLFTARQRLGQLLA